MSKGIVSRLRDTPEGARQHEREARMELGGLLEEAAATIEELLGALGDLEALASRWLRDANSPTNIPAIVAARVAIHNVVSNRRLAMDDREMVLDEAINACLARAAKLRAEAEKEQRAQHQMFCQEHVNTLFAAAQGAQECSEAIVELRTKGAKK